MLPPRAFHTSRPCCSVQVCLKSYRSRSFLISIRTIRPSEKMLRMVVRRRHPSAPAGGVMGVAAAAAACGPLPGSLYAAAGRLQCQCVGENESKLSL